MKKISVVLFAIITLAVTASAQPRSIGVRATYGAEVSYQHAMGDNSFLEADLGWSGVNGFNVSAMYDFIIGQEGAFNFYAGPGAALRVFSYNDADVIKTTLGLGIAGQVGMEYNFQLPLTLSLDWRPVFNFIGLTDFSWQSIALGIRYRF